MATHFRACNLCEAICELEIDGPHVLSIRGDGKNPLRYGWLLSGIRAQRIEILYRVTEPNDVARLRIMRDDE